MNHLTRKEFLRMCAALGVSSQLGALVSGTASFAQSSYEGTAGGRSTKVLVIGAGSAGLTAGYLLKRAGVEFQILEASSRFGGRVKRLVGFADFPIDLGGEWIHAEPSILVDIVDDLSVSVDIETMEYSPQTFKSWLDGRLKKRNWVRHFYSEYKFRNTTWYGFFENYIVPSIVDNISYNSVVTSIDYSGDRVLVGTRDGVMIEADKVLVTVPVAILQSQMISFTPAIPRKMAKAIDSIEMMEGLKVFFEFSELFYPDVLMFKGVFESLDGWEDKAFYDAAFGKASDRNVFTLFAVGHFAEPYVGLDDEQLGKKLLAELDEIFDGKASRYYLKHVVQNWSREPFIQGSYTSEFDDSEFDTIGEIFAPLANKVFFAGEAMGGDSQSTVHGASETALRAVTSLMKA